MSKEEQYHDAVNQVARLCARTRDPDRAFHSTVSGTRLSRSHFRDVMDFSGHPSAFADLLGDPVEKFTPDDWNAVIEQITYMSFRADVLERVAELKEGTK